MLKPFGSYYETEVFPALELAGEYMRAHGLDSLDIPPPSKAERRALREHRRRVRGMARANAEHIARVALDCVLGEGQNSAGA